MLINDVKKGTRVKLANGWYGTIVDSRKGLIRMVDVEGLYRETGSVYSRDIKFAKVNGEWVGVELSPAQQKTSDAVVAAGF